MGGFPSINMPQENANVTSALAARAYGYGYPGFGVAPYAAGALSPHRQAYYGMQEHINAEERMLEQRRTLYSDLRSAEAKEASAVEKRLSDEQTTATRLAEEHDAARRAAEADSIAHRAAEEHRIRAAEAKVTKQAANQAAASKAQEARDAESTLAASVAAEGQSMHERAGR